MAHLHKRITRKDLRQPDAFLVATGKIAETFQAHKRNILLSLALLILILGAFAGWSQYWQRQARLASIDYNRALELFHLGRYDEALSAFDNVLSYGSTSYSALAYYYRANAYMALNRPPEAKAAIDAALAKFPSASPLYEVALWSKAEIHHRAGGCAEALGSYRAVAQLQGALKDLALLAIGRCSESIGDKTAAIRAYKDYLAAFPLSAESPQIRLRVTELEAQVG